MTAIESNGITIEYEETGEPSAPVLLMIAGIGCQLIYWPPELIDNLADRGLRVIVFDSRDVGLSTKLAALGLPDLKTEIVKNMSGQQVDAPYLLDDMAADTVGLLDALGIDSAHIFGHSLGGMIGQLVCAAYPERCLSFTSMSSTSGNRSLPPGKPDALQALMTPPADPTDRESVIEKALWSRPALGSPAYPASPEEIRARAGAAFDRCLYPIGFGRQMLASMANGSRVELLETITVPSLVIHGKDDPLIRVEAGRDTAAHIPGARIVEIDGMGHDLPSQLSAQFADLIAEHCLG